MAPAGLRQQGKLPGRHIDLPGGRTLDVRPVTSADVDGLAALYEGLDSLDRQRRFFTFFRPGPQFLEKEATSAARGGLGLVAQVAATGSSRIVAEAGYSLLADGNGELAITVAEDWRGWLGPYLLDALLEAAAARGVPNLQADILVTNRPMLALMRARGYVTMGHPDWTVVRVLIATASRMPGWPGTHEGPRVLVEVPGARWRAEEAARSAGLQVLACGGPSGTAPHCPALAGEPCPLAAAADVIVVGGSQAGDGPWQALLEAHRRLHAGIPVCLDWPDGAVVPAHQGERRLPEADEAGVVQFLARLAGDGHAASASAPDS